MNRDRVAGIGSAALRVQSASGWCGQRAVGEVPVVPRRGLVVRVVIRERSESNLALGSEHEARAALLERCLVPRAVGVHERPLAGECVHHILKVVGGFIDVSGASAGTGRPPRRPQIGAVKARDSPEGFLRVGPEFGKSPVGAPQTH